MRVICELAEQTNLLALNAAIEAAASDSIAHSSDESTAALGQTTHSVHNLEGMAARMHEAAAQFSV